MDKYHQPDDSYSKGHSRSCLQRVSPYSPIAHDLPHRWIRRPQQHDQSNLTPQQGADLWKTHLEPLKAQGILLGSPAPSSAPSGKTWLQDFLTACGGGCSVDFIALHWYAINSTEFIGYLQDFHRTFQRPIWVTEWACQVGTPLRPSSRLRLNGDIVELCQGGRTVLATGRDQLHERHAIIHGRNGMG